MALDFQQVREQVIELGENAPARQRKLLEKRQLARQLLQQWAGDFEAIRQKASQAKDSDPALRCALPLDPQTFQPERLDAAFPLPPLPRHATIIAADGSQIPLDRHAEVEYCLVNVGAICLTLGRAEPPVTQVVSELLYDEELYSDSGMITDATLALKRDEAERGLLARMAQGAPPPVITFTDGPMELWGANEPGSDPAAFQKHLQAYLQTLRQMQAAGVVPAGYVDKPTADLMVRTLEVMSATPIEMEEIRKHHPLRGVKDFDLYRSILAPGERSALFALQSPASRSYRDILALHFFYINVGRPHHPWLARVEIPAWVAQDSARLDLLHAVIIDQCRTLGSSPYPYLLHRAHETAVVTFQEREQVTNMITLELRRHGVEPGEKSQKQIHKEHGGRTTY